MVVEGPEAGAGMDAGDAASGRRARRCRSRSDVGFERNGEEPGGKFSVSSRCLVIVDEKCMFTIETS